MRKLTRTLLVVAALGALAGLPAYASEGHGSMDMKGMEKGQGMAMEHGQHLGEMIRETKVDGYTFAYHLLDMKERMEAMKDMPGMSAMKGMDMSQMASHHLMVYVMGPDGKNVEDAKVGYLVKGPDGKEQKAMTMGMTGGHGADVDFKAKGMYDIKTKVVAGDKKLVDDFKYEVK